MAKKTTASKSTKPPQPARTEKAAKTAAKQPASPKAVAEQSAVAPEPQAPKPDAQAQPQTSTPKSKPSAASKPARAAKSVGGLTAACTFLAQAKEPMRVKDLTEALIKKGLWLPKGKTPHSTLAAAIGREIKDKGKDSRFKKTGRGLFSAAPVKA